jgi:hypothetical protein
MTDITDTLAPNSDQLDAIDLHHSGPRTFTVERVVVNKSDQPVNVHLVEFPRVWRPSKNMRRVLAECWGVDSASWTGGRITLYADMAVKFGNETPGGTRISHISGIDRALKVPIILTRGKTALYPVQPLVEQPSPAAPTADQIATATREQVSEWWGAHPNLRPQLAARAEELKAGDA